MFQRFFKKTDIHQLGRDGKLNELQQELEKNPSRKDQNNWQHLLQLFSSLRLGFFHYYAAANGKLDIVKYLISINANIEAKNNVTHII